jgi:SAM-dependent methyltransferase
VIASLLESVRSPARAFQSVEYLRHTQRRQEHLATLGLPLAGRSVFEVGAGIGDHTSFFLDRGCEVVVTEARPRNVRVLRQRLPGVDVRQLDLDDPPAGFDVSAQVTYCYGTLYHLGRPAEALEFMAARTEDMLLLETCVSPGDGDDVKLVPEQRSKPSQSVHGRGCRPTRRWVWNRLTALFDHVYVTRTQPWHEEFPLDWEAAPGPGLTRSVFVASRRPLELPTLVDHVPARQERP